MEILLNNKKEVIEGKETISVQELLQHKNFTYRMIIVKINNQLIKKELYNTTLIKEGDNVNILHLISGG